VRSNGLDSRPGTPGPQDALREEEERLQAAVELIAEMQLTSEQLRTGLRALAPGFGREFEGAPPADEAEARVREVARGFAQRLRDRAAEEIPPLPFERCGDGEGPASQTWGVRLKPAAPPPSQLLCFLAHW
jgi:hypothetical protein